MQTSDSEDEPFQVYCLADRYFNHTLHVDVFSCSEDSVLHVMDEAMNYYAVRYLRKPLAEALWRMLRFCCIDLYFKTLDLIADGAGKTLLQQSSKQKWISSMSRLCEYLFESPNSMTIVESVMQKALIFGNYFRVCILAEVASMHAHSELQQRICMPLQALYCSNSSPISWYNFN